ncbi:hypothetical protein K461DRAFT_324579 [Myriangium duriaei CBS 260.36]|uniref:Ribosomal protein L9 domain-containing protein n=1 Tax=Myriangium duriaei CBS 260.36 TaxID=1168546 RepID=A0A9P4IWL2_9PEZI|nr:hypothetical protein K461DRAFT_324579 [Myriangium duriaei CBS 260.36]
MTLFFSSLRSAGGSAASFPAPTCRSCTLRLAASLLSPSVPSQQVRGKKKLARDPGQITVRLSRDVPGVGRAGSYVPTTRGEMRNDWFISGVAAYVPLAQQRQLKKDKVPIIRDVLFGADSGKLSKRRQAQVDRAKRAGGVVTGIETDETVEVEKEILPGTTVERVEPSRSQELISVLVPGRLDFARQVQSAETGTIFGSVTTADVAAVVTQALAHNDEASRVLVTEEDIIFIDVKDEGGNLAVTNRVKSLGRFKVEIKVKGAEEPVMRIVNIVSQETAPRTVEAATN